MLAKIVAETQPDSKLAPWQSSWTLDVVHHSYVFFKLVLNKPDIQRGEGSGIDAYKDLGQVLDQNSTRVQALVRRGHPAGCSSLSITLS